MAQFVVTFEEQEKVEEEEGDEVVVLWVTLLILFPLEFVSMMTEFLGEEKSTTPIADAILF